MIQKLSSTAIRFILGGPGLGLIVVLALAGSVFRLASLQNESDQLQAIVSQKQEDLSRNIASSIGKPKMKIAKSKLSQWRSLAEQEAQRIASLSITALDANVAIISLGSLDSMTIEKQNLVQLSHEIETVGEQHQIAQFLDGLYAMEGMASIQSLDISPEDEGNPEMLLASMKVTWFAPLPNEVVSP